MSISVKLVAGTAAVTLSAYAIYITQSSKPTIGKCCPGQALGFLPQDVNYSPKGKMKTINNVEVYVTGSGPEAVVMFHDIFGLHTGRHKQIADELASRDLTVVVPDFFGNESSEFAGGLNKKEERGYGGGLARFMYLLISGKFKAFQQQHPWDPVCKNIWVDTIAPYVKNDLKCTSVGLLSFCWGAYPAVHATVINPPASNLPVRANVCFHPSFDRTAANWSEDQEQVRNCEERAGNMIIAVNTNLHTTHYAQRSWLKQLEKYQP